MENSIIHEVKIASNVIKRSIDAKLTQNGSYADITGSQCKILSYLAKSGDKDVFQRDIEKDFSIRRSTATQILQSMEKNGLIVRMSSQSDARLKKLMLTEKAQKIREDMEKIISETEMQAQKGLTAEEKECFFNVISKIKDNLSW
ncbi:MAG: MarR family transcriptional regulator [Clostridia bacterium]|nr:MarR family transcriptional regulator [Clostridia bacterium]